MFLKELPKVIVKQVIVKKSDRKKSDRKKSDRKKVIVIKRAPDPGAFTQDPVIVFLRKDLYIRFIYKIKG